MDKQETATGNQHFSKYDRVSPIKGFHRYGTVLKVSTRSRKAMVQWDDEHVTPWYLVSELRKEG